MAGLTAGELTKRQGRVALFLSMIEGGSPMEVQTKQGVKKLVFPEKGNEAVFAAFRKAVKQDKEVAARTLDRLAFIHPTEGKFALGKFVKTTEFSGIKSGANKGDLAEAVFGAAIVARFVSRDRNVSVADVEQALLKIVSRGTRKGEFAKHFEYDAPAANGINDTVYYYLSLPKKAHSFLNDRKKWRDIKDLFESSVRYANSEKVKAWATLFYHNGVYDYIEVLAAGLDDQSGTKVDVRVQVRHGSKDVPPVRTDINVSLKAGNVKQFGQVGGATYEKQKDLWLRLAAIDINPIEKQYALLFSKGKIEEALMLSYSFVLKQMTTTLKNKSKKKEFLKRLADGIRYFATLNEDTVELVQLEGGKSKVFNFDTIQEILTTIELGVELAQSAGKPKLVFFAEGSKKVFLEIRVKAENRSGAFYIRNYVEKGPLMTDLMAIIH